ITRMSIRPETRRNPGRVRHSDLIPALAPPYAGDRGGAVATFSPQSVLSQSSAQTKLQDTTRYWRTLDGTGKEQVRVHLSSQSSRSADQTRNAQNTSTPTAT